MSAPRYRLRATGAYVESLVIVLLCYWKERGLPEGVQRCSRAELARWAGIAPSTLNNWIRGHTLRQHLDGDCAMEPAVVGFIHLSHTSRAEEGFDLEMAEGCAGREGHGNWTARVSVSDVSPTCNGKALPVCLPERPLASMKD